MTINDGPRSCGHLMDRRGLNSAAESSWCYRDGAEGVLTRYHRCKVRGQGDGDGKPGQMVLSGLGGVLGEKEVVCTGCVTEMYPSFESKWFSTFSKLRQDLYTIVKKMKFCSERNKLRLPSLINVDTVSRLNDQRKGFYIAISLRVRRSEGVRAYPDFESK